MSTQSNIIALNTIKAPVIKGSIESIETNSKGDKTTWLRLAKEIKENGGHIVTSKSNQEYAVEMPSVNFDRDIQWLYDNRELTNIRQWIENKLIEANRPIVALAGAANQSHADIIGDLQSLIAFDTLESARGRTASRLNADQWKIFLPIFTAATKKHFESKGAPESAVKQLVGKWINLCKASIVSFSPIGEVSTYEFLAGLLEATLGEFIEVQPDNESIALFAVTVNEKNKETHGMSEADLSAWE